MRPFQGRAEPPLSPCVRICVMDEARHLCQGCGRTLDEITRWWSMNDDEKRAVLAGLPARGPAGKGPAGKGPGGKGPGGD